MKNHVKNSAIIVSLTLSLASVVGIGTTFALAPSATDEDTVQPFTSPPGDASQDGNTENLQAHIQTADDGKIYYISGGVADSGMEAIDQQKSGYNLKLLFVSAGEYLGRVGVHITDTKGNIVLDTTSDGPAMLVKMPAGHYTISTLAPAGSSLVRHVSVDNRHLASYVLNYPTVEQ